MTTNQDILSFLKAEKEARETEKEQERADRQREREEDMAKIAEMIKDGVKEEVKTMLNPLDKRLEGQEKITEGLGVQMKNLVGEIEILRKEIRAGNEFPVLPAQPSGLVGEKSRGVSGGDTAQGDGEAEDVRDARIKEICSKARRIVGFTPIEPRMLDIQMNSYGARDIEEAMLQEIKSYWKCEMKVKPSDIEKINIVRIFPPAKDDWDTLYIEFENEIEVDKMFRYTRVMCKPDHRLVRYIPKELYERFRSLDFITYTRREDMKAKGLKLKTRVKIGRKDLDLSVKLPNSGWKSEPLPHGLPDIDLQAGGRHSVASSPPPGRPQLITRNPKTKRQLSGSDNEDSTKKARGDKVDTTDSNDKGSMIDLRQEEGTQGDRLNRQKGNNMHSSIKSKENPMNLDIGQFTNTEAYSPATPAKAKSIPDLSVVINSPVFHNKAKSNK